MAVKIRLKRMGTRGKPFYRVVVADSRAARDGRFIDTLGYYDPKTEPPMIKIDEDRALMWLNRGAQPTDTAAALLKKEDILGKYLASKQQAGKQPAGEEAAAAEEPAAETAKPATRRTRTKAADTAEPVAEAPVAEPEGSAEETQAAEAEAAEEQQTEEQG